MSYSKIDRIASLIVQGLPPNLIASLTATTPSFIASLLKDATFAEMVSDLRQEAIQEELETEAEHEYKEFGVYKNKLAGLETQLLDKVASDLGSYLPEQTLKALSVVGARRDAISRRGLEEALAKRPAPSITNTTVVELHLPEALQPDIVYGANNEIIQIGGRTTAPMGTEALNNLLAAHLPSKEKEVQTYEYLQN